MWRTAKNSANTMAVLSPAAKLMNGIHREASHTAFFKACYVNQDVIMATLIFCRLMNNAIWHTPVNMYIDTLQQQDVKALHAYNPSLSC